MDDLVLGCQARAAIRRVKTRPDRLVCLVGVTEISRLNRMGKTQYRSKTGGLHGSPSLLERLPKVFQNIGEDFSTADKRRLTQIIEKQRVLFFISVHQRLSAVPYLGFSFGICSR